MINKHTESYDILLTRRLHNMQAGLIACKDCWNVSHVLLMVGKPC